LLKITPMKKILLFLLLSIVGYGQIVPTGQEQDFGYGMRNTASQLDDNAAFITVQDVTGVQGKSTSSVWAKKIYVDNADATKSFLSTGLIKNGLVTTNADPTKFNITAGIGIITNFDNPESPTSTIVSFPAFTGITPAYLLTSNITYVAITLSGSTPVVLMQATAFDNVQRRNVIALGAVIHSNLSTINLVNNISAPTNAGTNQLHDLYEFIGALNLTGNKYTANGANLSLDKTAGTIGKLGVNFANNWRDPNRLSIGLQTLLTFRYRTQNGTESGDLTVLNPAVYDLANVLTSVPSNKFSIQTVTLFQTGQTRIQYGQNVYNTLAEAEAAILTRSYVVENNIAMNGIARAYIILKNTATSLQNASDTKIVEAQKFGGIVSGGAAITDSAIIAALGYTPANDVDVVKLTTNQTIYGEKTIEDPIYYNNNLANEKSILGSELIDGTGWTSTGWTGTFGTGFTSTSPNTLPLYKVVASSGTNVYRVTFTVNGTSPIGEYPLSVTLGNSLPFDIYKGGTNPVSYTLSIKSVSNGNLVFTPGASFTGTITNISVKQVTTPFTANTTKRDSNGVTIYEERNSLSVLDNLFFGINSGKNNYTGEYNTILGSNSFISNVEGFWNSTLGKNTLLNNINGSRNNAIGYLALESNLYGHRNNAIGTFALRNNTNGSANIAIGADALNFNTIGNNNVGIGLGSLYGTVNGSDNIGIGRYSGQGTISGINNISIGKFSNLYNAAGSNNIYIGTDSGSGSSNVSGDNNILIGNSVAVASTNQSNHLNIGNVLFGDLTNRYIGLGTTTPGTLGSILYPSRHFEIFNGGLDLTRATNTNNDYLGNIAFYNTNNLGLGATTRNHVVRIQGLVSTTNSNANGDSGGHISFSTKLDVGAIAERMRLTDKGNLIINTTTDDGTNVLQVNGSTKTTALILTTTPTTSVGTYDIITRNTSTGVVEKVGSLPLSVVKISTNTTLDDTYNGKIILLTASCTVTLPNGLMSGFNCSFSTQTGVTMTYALGGSIVLINNIGTTMAEKLSHTIVNTGVSNEYLTAGSL